MRTKQKLTIMTLIAIQRKNDIVTFDSDSRLTLGESTYFDLGAKLFEIPVRIRGPLHSISDANKWEFENVFGMAIAGSTINAYALKESISHILSHITYLSNCSDVSIIGLGYFIRKRFVEISKKLMALFRTKGLSEIVIAGYCLMQKRIRILRFFWTLSSDSIDFQVEEILKSDGLFFAGSGKSAADKVYKDNPLLTPMQIIKAVIDDRMDESVGGLLQHGLFSNNNFGLSGVMEDICSEETGERTKISHFLGFELSAQKVSNDYPMLFISYGATPIDWKHPKWKQE